MPRGRRTERTQPRPNPHHCSMVEGEWVDRNAIRIRLRLLVAALQRNRLRHKRRPAPPGVRGDGAGAAEAAFESGQTRSPRKRLILAIEDACRRLIPPRDPHAVNAGTLTLYVLGRLCQHAVA